MKKTGICRIVRMLPVLSSRYATTHLKHHTCTFYENHCEIEDKTHYLRNRPNQKSLPSPGHAAPK